MMGKTLEQLFPALGPQMFLDYSTKLMRTRYVKISRVRNFLNEGGIYFLLSLGHDYRCHMVLWEVIGREILLLVTKALGMRI